MAIVKILSSRDVYKNKDRLQQNRGKSSEKQHRGNHEKPTKTRRKHKERLRKQRETFTKPLEEVRKKNNIAKTMAIVTILSSKDVYKNLDRLQQNRGKSSEKTEKTEKLRQTLAKQHRGNHEKPTKTQRTFEKATRDFYKTFGRGQKKKQHRQNHGDRENS
jgi:hypothetical protein